MKDLIPCILLATCVISMIFIWETRPPTQGTVLAVFPSADASRDIGKILKSTDGALVGKSRLPGAYLVSSRTPGFSARLKQNGALFVFDAAPGLGCTVPAAPE